MRLIDADALIDELEEELGYAFPNMTDTVQSAMKSAFRIAIRRAKKAPTIEAEHVLHGKWEAYPSDVYMRCSNCRVEYLKKKILWSYCPHCGAKMDLK